MLLKEYKKIEKNSNGYRIYGDAADIQLIFMSDDIFRLRVSFDRDFKEESYSLVTTAWEDRLDDLLSAERNRIEALDVAYEETDRALTFKTKKLTVVMKKSPLHFLVYNEENELIYSDLAERAFEQDQLGRAYHYNLIDPKADHFYGFGETTGHLDKKGRRLRMAPKDAIGHDPETGGPLYKHIPFYVRLNDQHHHAYGMFYHNSYESVFDMGQEISGYWDPYSYYEADGGDVDLFFINGPSVKSVVDRYTDLTGKQAMPPKQSLGFTASTMYYAELEENCDEEIYGVIEKHRNNGMYIDNFKLASGYSSGEEDNLRYVFNWNKKRFPNPQEFFDKMNAMGINVIVNLKPGILENHPLISEFEDNDVFIKNPNGAGDYIGRWWGGAGRFVDFTKPASRDTWKKMLKESVLERGTVTVWNDNCEYDGIENRNALCDFEGVSGKISQLKPVQANLMALVAKEAVAEVYPNLRPYIINRAGHTGIQRYAQTWAGDNLTDWRTIKFNIMTIMGMGLSGVANTGCDIGGFAGGAPEGELLLRWIQNGIFQPRFCINSANDDNTVTQPWMYEEYNTEVSAAYRQRYQMLPYLYSLMHEAHETGMPILRPLFMEFQDDANCYDDRYFTFMFGPSVLVANVVDKGAATRELYLPQGTKWYHLNDQMRCYEGGQVIEIPVDLASIPMFIREDGIFITSDDVTQIKRDAWRTLDITFGGADNSHFAFYEDDGETQDFEKGSYEKTAITVSGADKKVIRFATTGSYTSQVSHYNLKVVSKKQGAYWVTVAGQKIKQFLGKEDWLNAESGWYYNLSDRTVCVKFAKPAAKDFEVIVSVEKFDLIGMVLKD